MDAELYKRLEEAARKEVPDILRMNENYVESFRTGFCLGGEWMFKECGGMIVLHDMRKLILAQCKAWLFEHGHTDTGILLEIDMNKLWEEKK